MKTDTSTKIILLNGKIIRRTVHEKTIFGQPRLIVFYYHRRMVRPLPKPVRHGNGKIDITHTEVRDY